MADTKVSAMTENTDPQPGDFLYLSDGGAADRKIELATLGHLTPTTGSDADTTMSVGMLYTVAMSGWATAVRTYSLPTTAAVGDRIGIYITSGNATHELAIRTTAASNDTIDGVDYDSADWSKLFITGEYVEFMCVTANTAWITVVDGRIACAGYMTLGTALSTHSAGVATKIDFDTQQYDIGDIADPTTNNRFDARRAGKWYCLIGNGPNASISADNYYGGALRKNGSRIAIWRIRAATATSAYYQGCSKITDISDGDYIEGYMQAQEANIGCIVSNNDITYLICRELLT